MNRLAYEYDLPLQQTNKIFFSESGGCNFNRMSDPPLMESSDCYATWSGPPTEDRASVASKGKTVGFEKQNSVDQDMVRMEEKGEMCIS